MLFALGNIADEIHQTRPFSSAAEEAVVTLVATANRVRERIAEPIERAGITPQQYNVLRILRGAGEAGIPTLDIAARMLDRSPGITRLLARLESRRLVRRKRCPSDARQVLCYSTAEGLRLLAALDAPVAETALRCLAPLGGARTEQLIALLDELRAASATSRPAAE
jgi:DNA-binding MarR family transcriptional regulator